MYSIAAPLCGLEFVVDPKLKNQQEITRTIKQMKGTIGYFISKQTAAVISDVEGVEEMGFYCLESARKVGIQVVPVKFLDDVKISDPYLLINEMNLSPWPCIDVSRSLLFFVSHQK